MTRAWLGLLQGPAPGATAIALVRDEDGGFAGFLAAWHSQAKPVRDALRVDPRVIDPLGEPAWVSLVRAPQGVRLLFDDHAVQQARRRVLAERPPAAVSTLLRDSSHFEGAISAYRGADARSRAHDDPFARVFPARIVHVGAGLIASRPPPAGPTIERYGSANPWPWDRFPD